jgi:hypothetical protein
MKAAPRKLGLAEVTAIGIGGMIGGGIFAVLGLAIAQAGHAVPVTLAVGGVIALLTGLSYAHLGLAFHGDGGSFTYIEHAFGSPGLAAVAGWVLVAGYVGTLALYATAFGAYGATLVAGTGAPAYVSGSLAALVLVSFMAVNLGGAKTSGMTELIVVAVKLTILAAFAIAGIWTVQASHFHPLFDKGALERFPRDVNQNDRRGLPSGAQIRFRILRRQRRRALWRGDTRKTCGYGRFRSSSLARAHGKPPGCLILAPRRRSAGSSVGRRPEQLTHYPAQDTAAHRSRRMSSGCSTLSPRNLT